MEVYSWLGFPWKVYGRLKEWYAVKPMTQFVAEMLTRQASEGDDYGTVEYVILGASIGNQNLDSKKGFSRTKRVE
jgi:hypothetical protein